MCTSEVQTKLMRSGFCFCCRNKWHVSENCHKTCAHCHGCHHSILSKQVLCISPPQSGPVINQGNVMLNSLQGPLGRVLRRGSHYPFNISDSNAQGGRHR